MAKDDDLTIGGWLAVGVVIYAINSCAAKPEDTDNYKKGFEAGHSAGYGDGLDDEHAIVCQQIENYKDSIHNALQAEGICP